MPYPQRLGRLARFAGAVALACAAAAAAVGPVAADGGAPGQTFAEIVNQAKLIVVARIGTGPDGGVTLDVERVLKGTAVARMAFPPTDIGPPLDDWNRAIVAFTNPTTIDFRAPTIAWHLAGDGVIDPEGFQQYPGIPRTLDAMLAAFGQDAIESTSAFVATPVTAPAIDPPRLLPAVVVGVAATGLAALLIFARWRRRAQ